MPTERDTTRVVRCTECRKHISNPPVWWDCDRDVGWCPRCETCTPRELFMTGSVVVV